jgi:hypothetical protein
MRRLLFTMFGAIAMALPICAVADVTRPLPPPVALVPQVAPVPAWSGFYCPDPVTHTVQTYTRRWFRGRLVTWIQRERQVVACNRYHPPSVFVDERDGAAY